MGWTIGVLGFDSRRGLGIFLFITSSRTALGLTQPPIHWVPGALSLGVKQPGREAGHSPPSSAEVKEWVELYPTPQYAFMAWCSVKRSTSQLYLYSSTSTILKSRDGRTFFLPAFLYMCSGKYFYDVSLTMVAEFRTEGGSKTKPQIHHVQTSPSIQSLLGCSSQHTSSVFEQRIDTITIASMRTCNQKQVGINKYECEHSTSSPTITQCKCHFNYKNKENYTTNVNI
jgi:hypothetical protein